MKLYPLPAVWDCNANVGGGKPVALTVNTRATPTVATSGPGLAPNAGAVTVATFTVTIWVATPCVLLAVNVKTCVLPLAANGG